MDTRYITRVPGDLRPGDMLDLEGDSVADTPATDSATRATFADLHAEVISVAADGPQCVLVCTDSGSFGFPLDHELRVAVVEEEPGDVPVMRLPQGFIHGDEHTRGF